MLTSRGCSWLNLLDPVRARPVAVEMFPTSCTCRGGSGVQHEALASVGSQQKFWQLLQALHQAGKP